MPIAASHRRSNRRIVDTKAVLCASDWRISRRAERSRSSRSRVFDAAQQGVISQCALQPGPTSILAAAPGGHRRRRAGDILVARQRLVRSARRHGDPRVVLVHPSPQENARRPRCRPTCPCRLRTPVEPARRSTRRVRQVPTSASGVVSGSAKPMQNKVFRRRGMDGSHRLTAGLRPSASSNAGCRGTPPAEDCAPASRPTVSPRAAGRWHDPTQIACAGASSRASAAT